MFFQLAIRAARSSTAPAASAGQPASRVRAVPATDSRDAAIIPTTAGRRPFMQPLTMPFSWKAAKHRATIRIMTKEGSTTPKVAHTAPKNPAVSAPM